MRIRPTTVALFFLASAPALPAQAPRPQSSGFTFGLSAGLGHTALNALPQLAETRGRDVAIGWRVGYRFSPKIALVVNGASDVYTYRGTGRTRKRGFEGVFPSVQVWFRPRLWAAAGAGLNLDAPAFYDIRSSNPGERDFHRGIGAIGIVGYELGRAGIVGIDAQARVHAGFNDFAEGRQRGRSISLLLGISR
jgi:hypothetical protein